MAPHFAPGARLPRRVFLQQQARLFTAAAASAAACACSSAWPNSGLAQTARTLPGIDSLEADYFAPLLGRRIGLITNQTGIDSRGRRTIDLFARNDALSLAAIFSPEHGIAGKSDGGATVTNSTDGATGVKIFSLYGATRRPTPEMLAGIDALVFDIQDAGVRFYTYITTMAYAMEEAAHRRIPFFVLDRPNPLGGEIIEGPMLDADRTSFTAYFSLPVRYAMTIGELAQMFNTENKIGADLHMVPLKSWPRAETYADTGLAWIPPSPNLQTLDAIFLYPGLEILQAGDVSVGRGTDSPLEILGAPWIRGADLAAELTRRAIPGLRFTATDFTPRTDLHAGARCEGVSIRVTHPRYVRSMQMGIEIASALHRTYPAKFQLEKIIFLLGSRSTLEALKRGDAPADIIASWSSALDKFRLLRQKYLLYSDAGATPAAASTP